MSEIESIQYCMQCGSGLDRQLLFGLERPVCPACGWIYFADPKVAAGVLVDTDAGVLLVRRVNEPGRGLWSFPAGFVNAYEDPARAAARECLEETGLEVQITGLLDVIAGREHPRGADIVIVYGARILAGQPSPGDDADQVQFFPRDALPPLAFRAAEVALGKRYPESEPSRMAPTDE